MRESISAVFFCLIVAGCAIAEQDFVMPEEKAIAVNPVFASPTDSVKVFNAKSAIQRSPEYILSSSIVFKDGRFQLDMTPEEIIESGISEKVYKAYQQKLEKLNNSIGGN